MYFLALATDYDGTIARAGIVDEATIRALRALKQSGRKLLLVTGRELPDLKSVFPELDLFDRVVAENGALIYVPETQEERLIAPAAHEALVERLRAANLSHLSVGRSIIATCRPHEALALEAIRDLGLELQIIFNKEAVMILPSNVNKATGLSIALDDLGLSPLNMIAFGDAENDHAFLRMSGCAVAVENALPSLKHEADIIAGEPDGAGVTGVIASLLQDERHNVLEKAKHLRVNIEPDRVGAAAFKMSPASGCLLIAGGSGGGKSTLTVAIVELLAANQFQLCVLDPEGDYEELENAVVIGNAKSPIRVAEVLEILGKPRINPIVNLLGVDIADRPEFFREVLAGLTQLRAGVGRPHWLVIDEAHHMLPATRCDSSFVMSEALSPAILVTVHSTAISAAALAVVDTILTVGENAREEIERFCAAVQETCPEFPDSAPQTGQALLWKRGKNKPVCVIDVPTSLLSHQRHTRKYAEGNLGDKSFYFRGPHNELNLRAQNFMIFLQIADGIDDATWSHHLNAGDYSKWIRETVKDQALADEISGVEADKGLSPSESRSQIRESLTRRYTAPAQAS